MINKPGSDFNACNVNSSPCVGAEERVGRGSVEVVVREETDGWRECMED